TYHYRQIKIDDKFSKKAFKQFLDGIDHGKQFLLAEDVKKLKKYELKIDDQIVSGEFKLMNSAIEILKKRIAIVDNYRKEIFKKSFNFNQSESLELKTEKRKYPKSIHKLKEHWRKIFKYAVVSHYLTLLEQQQDEIKESKKPKKDKAKKVNKRDESLLKLSKKQLREKAKKYIDKKYKKIFSRLSEENREDHLESFFNAVSNVFDPHTNYLPPRKKEDFDIDISGNLEGIGAVLQEDGSFIKVVRIVTGGAAWRQKGLEVGDYILSVRQGNSGESVSLVDMKSSDAVRYIRGKKGTNVVLYVKKLDGSRKSVTITRDIIEIGANFAKSSVIGHKNLDIKIGHIQVPKFYRDFGNNSTNCTDDVKRELQRLKKLKVDAIILDLRNNGGGALEDARQMSGLFIEEGPIVQVRNHLGQIEVLKDNDPAVVYDGPLVVMINRFSASASEILAGVLQDYKRAIIVGGANSHGKGTVQAILNLNQGPLINMFDLKIGALKVTIQMFYRVIGDSTQYRGIVPDIVLPDPLGHIKNREQDLEYSLPWDKVEPQKFTSWTKQKYNLSLLKKRSKLRVKKNKRFKRIKESIAYLTKRSEETSISLNIKDIIKEDEQSKKMAKKLKLDEENKNITIANYEASLKAAHKIKPGDEKHWREDFEQRKDEMKKSIRMDTLLEESIYIINDMVNLMKGKKLAKI
ncbi:MAG: carboxy terminal-processing peptidase, partial [Halobacteriovoraceae bacterium]|nr:carboxy terminal-processing peptidase [Halobacteriovoraceae bacterium]